MSIDLRNHPCQAVIDRVQVSLGLKLDQQTEIRKRRSIGFRTMTDTWVRVEVRARDRIDGQGWNGVECAEILDGVSKPAWLQGIAWIDRCEGLAWRADETELVADPPIKPGGILTVMPELSAVWWETLTTSLDSLAVQATSRRATPGMRPLTQERVTDTIHTVFPEVDTTIREWTTAHGDFAWANLTASNCVLLDWEDWGTAPRGYDSAVLWSESLAVPALAARVEHERQVDLDSRTGLLMRLYCCAKLVAAGHRAGLLLEPARDQAGELVSLLNR